MRPPTQVRVVASPDKVQLGQPFTVEVVITHVAEQILDFNPPAELGAFELGTHERSRVDGADTATTTFKLTFACFELGKQRTPRLDFRVAEGAISGTLETAGTEVEVLSSLPADADQSGAGLFDVRPPQEVAVRTWRLLYALGAMLLVGGLAYALMRYLNRPKPAELVAAKPKEPLHTRTLAALDKLRGANLPGQGRVQEFYFRLSEILRAYLGERYAFEAMESTSYELMESLRTLHTPGLPVEQLKDFCLQSDLAKFARFQSTPDDCKASLEFGYQLVYATSTVTPPNA